MSEKGECVYCGRLVTEAPIIPLLDDPEGWRQVGEEHAPSCEWVATRAHRLMDDEPDLRMRVEDMEPYEPDDEPYDSLLAQQELEDHAQDGEFENMPPGGYGEEDF